MRKKLGEYLIQAGLITGEDLQMALAEHRRTGERVGAVLVRLNLATEKQIIKALAYQLGVPYVSLTDDPPDRAALALIPKDVALERVCVAIKLEGNLLTVATVDPLLISLVKDLELQTGHFVKQVVATRSDILDSIASGYPASAIAAAYDTRRAETETSTRDRPSETTQTSGGQAVAEATDTGDRVTRSEAAEIDDLLDLVINTAITSLASDVHIEPTGRGAIVRYRLDGLLKESMELPGWVHEKLAARIKTLAGMDAGERRLPQEGRLRFSTRDGRSAEYRVSTLSTLLGEKIALCARDGRKEALPLEELGLSAAAMEEVRGFFRHQHGMILVVGPAGSGKTTTLSSAISSIASDRANIVTIEDPIEYRVAGVTQTQIDDEVNLTVPRVLRAVLRQDPDVVLVGELRDRETAALAMEAAQRGQLVLSALYTDDASSAVTRLVDMAIEPHVIASALVGVIAQRLIRRLCVACRRQYTPDAETIRALSITEASAGQFVFYHAVGCDECHHTGYRGRIALFEVMRVSDKVRRLIAQESGEDLIRDAAIEAGMVSLGADGLGKVKAGISTSDELLRVVTAVREMRSLCPGCSGPVAIDFKVCPQCGHRLSGGCAKCDRALQPDWKFCPYCAASTASHKKKKKKFKEHKTREVPASNVAEFKIETR